MSETTHTPLPWKMAERFVEDFVIRGANDAAVAYVIGRTSHVRLDPEANMRLIVTAVNHHAELVEALRAHDAYMLSAGYSGPESDALHPNAAENWRRIRDLLARIKEGA